MGGRGTKGEGLATQVSLRAAHSINTDPCGPVGNYNRGIGSQVVKKIMFFLLKRNGSKKQFETVTLKIRGPVF
jgi:hypothetical protein